MTFAPTLLFTLKENVVLDVGMTLWLGPFVDKRSINLKTLWTLYVYQL